MKLKEGYPCDKPCKEYLYALCQNSKGCDGSFFMPCGSSCFEYRQVGSTIINEKNTLFTEKNVKDIIIINECDSCSKRRK